MAQFFLEAFEYVNNGKATEYERRGDEVDKRVEELEPGMLIHAHTKIAEGDDVTVYRWLEVFSKYEDLQTHMDNPHVQAHIEWLNSGILTKPVQIVIYCDWTEEQKAPIRQLEGVDISFASLVNGYFR